MNIQAPLIYDKDAYKALFRLTRRKGLAIAAPIVLGFYLLTRVWISIRIGYEFRADDVLALIFLLFILFRECFTPILAYKREKKLKRKEMYITFLEEGFFTQVTAENFAGSGTTSYACLQRAWEGRTHFIFCSKEPRGSYILKKDRIQPEDFAMLRQKLQDLLGKKYKTVNR